MVFVALMFIGAGIGLLFGRPDVGGAVGMGLGFLAMALMRTRYREIKPERTDVVGPLVGSAILGLVGALFVAAGLVLLFNVRIPWKVLGGLGALAVGLFFLAVAFRLLSATRPQVQTAQS